MKKSSDRRNSFSTSQQDKTNPGQTEPQLGRRRLLKGSLAGGGAALASPLLASLSTNVKAESTGAATAKLVFGPVAPEFKTAIRKLRSILGNDGVVTDDHGLQIFHDPYYYDQKDHFVPSAALLPTSVEQIQQILRIANEYHIPLWTSSTGRNYGYGGAAPEVNGTLVLNLQRMNKVLEINQESGYAVVEPGVSFIDLYEALGKETDHRWWMSCPDIGWGSVIGNTLEHGMGYTPFGDHSHTQCGMEVVLANGEIVRTGMGAMTGNKSWHLFHNGFGPRVDTLFMQSNFGIVTRMGVWLMPRPEIFLSGNVDIKRDEDLPLLVNTIRPLMIERTIHNYPILGNILGYASFISTRDKWYQGAGPMPEAEIQKISDTTGIGRWSMRFALYGYESVVDAHYGIIKKAIGSISGSGITARKYPGTTPRDKIDPVDHSQAGIPGLEIMSLTRWYGGEGGHLGCSPVTPLVGEDVQKQARLARQIIEKHGHDYMCGMILSPRSVIHVVELIFDTNKKELTRSAYMASRELVKASAKLGYGEYRSHLDTMDLVAGEYDFNNHALGRLTGTLKDAIDPNGILSPGKQGIWPKSMRKEKI